MYFFLFILPKLDDKQSIMSDAMHFIKHILQ